MDKNFITIIIAVLISGLVWIGFTVYFSNNRIDIDPNASSYIAPITAEFDSVTIMMIKDRIESYLPITTDEYKSLSLPEEVLPQSVLEIDESDSDNVADEILEEDFIEEELE